MQHVRIRQRRHQLREWRLPAPPAQGQGTACLASGLRLKMEVKASGSKLQDSELLSNHFVKPAVRSKLTRATKPKAGFTVRH